MQKPFQSVITVNFVNQWRDHLNGGDTHNVANVTFSAVRHVGTSALILPLPLLPSTECAVPDINPEKKDGSYRIPKLFLSPNTHDYLARYSTAQISEIFI